MINIAWSIQIQNNKNIRMLIKIHTLNSVWNYISKLKNLDKNYKIIQLEFLIKLHKKYYKNSM